MKRDRLHSVILEVATPTATPPPGRGYHALTWRSHGHSLAAYLWHRLRQTVLLPGKCTVWRALTGKSTAWRRWRHS